MSTAIILVYVVTATAIGSVMARRARSSRDWAVAGGGMSTVLVAVGIAGTRIGGAGTYGVAGDVIRGGVWNLWWYGISTFLALAGVGMFFAVYYRRLGLQTVGELFTVRWANPRCQWTTSLCVQTEYFIVNLIEAYVIGVMVSTLTPLPMGAGVLVAAAVFSTYVSLGGLWGTAVTNLIHCAVVVVGLLWVGIAGVAQLGGWAAMTGAVDRQLAEAGRDARAWWHIAGAGWLPVIAMVFSAAVHTPAASVYTNYATAARRERDIAPAFVLGGCIAASMSILAGLIGLLTVARHGLDAGLVGYRNITTVASEISPLVGGVALAAVLGAVISSGGPILLSSATMFVRDWLTGIRADDSPRTLSAYRWTTRIYAVVAALAAWVVARYTSVSILDLLLFGFAMVVPPAVAVGYVIYWPRTTERGAYAGIVSGYAAGLIWFTALELAAAAGLGASGTPSLLGSGLVYALTVDGVGIDPSYFTTVVPLVVVPCVSYLTTDRTGDRARFYAALRGDP